MCQEWGCKRIIDFCRQKQFDLPKKRTCTFGLHGPWGDATSVFIRVSFTFPRDYPQAPFPGGVPQVELERNPLIRIETRVKILRRLKAIRERQRPCLEACLRFLLFGSDDESSLPRAIDSESSSDEAFPSSRRPRDSTVSLLPGDKNLAEPRTSQGVFGANGAYSLTSNIRFILIVFLRASSSVSSAHHRE